MHGHTFNVLYRDWIANKLANLWPSAKEQQMLNKLLTMQPWIYALELWSLLWRVKPIVTRLVPDGGDLNSPCRYCGLQLSSQRRKKSSLHDFGRQLNTLTGLTLLACTPNNWHSHWLFNWEDVDHSLKTVITDFTRRGPQMTTQVTDSNTRWE